MTSAYPPVVNVAHIAGKDGKCARCKAGIGCFTQVADADNGLEFVERPWKDGERVIEYECPDGRTRFADSATGFTIDCRE